MDKWLVVASIGPVGHFIGGGRRSRDLWWGSTWLSECTRAVAKTLEQSGAELILPSRERLKEIEDLARKGDPLSYGGRITNRVVAVVDADDSRHVAVQVAACEKAAYEHLAGILQKVHDKVTDEPGERRDAVRNVLEESPFQAQLQAIRDGDFVEVYAAWARHGPSAWKRADELLAARKTARLFTAPAWARGARRKSDLDPGRDSVLCSGHAEDHTDSAGPNPGLRLARGRLGIRPDEDLDAVGLARRIAIFQRGPNVGRLPFPPLSRVAADTWLRAVADDPECSGALARIRGILKDAKDDSLFFTWCSPARDPEVPWLETPADGGLFPFDASLLLEGGLDALAHELQRARGEATAEVVDQALARLEALRPAVLHLHKVRGVPHPYYGLLAMDGDGIGAALETERDFDRQRQRVAALDQFADRAEKIVSHHHGCAFFVGGDELTAYLPAATAPAAARELALSFQAVEQAFAPVARVSLSGGLVLAHVKADLRGTRALAHDALANAKLERRRAAGDGGDGRQAWLEVREVPRSGVARSCCGALAALVENLEAWKELLTTGEIAARSAHLLLSYRDRFAAQEEHGDRGNSGHGGNRGNSGHAGKGDLGLGLARHRLLAQARRDDRKENKRLTTRIAGLETWEDAEGFAAELTIAARLREAGLFLEPKPVIAR